MSDKVPKYIFKAKTKQASVIKILGELLNNTIKFSPFCINEKGIFLTQQDAKNEQLIDIALYKENFSSYKCEKQLKFIINSQHLYRMLKSIKKKDGIILFITEEDEYMLGFSIEQSEENNKITKYIRTSEARIDIIQKPEGYDNPIITTSKEFQRMKTLHNFSKTNDSYFSTRIY